MAGSFDWCFLWFYLMLSNLKKKSPNKDCKIDISFFVWWFYLFDSRGFISNSNLLSYPLPCFWLMMQTHKPILNYLKTPTFFPHHKVWGFVDVLNLHWLSRGNHPYLVFRRYRRIVRKRQRSHTSSGTEGDSPGAAPRHTDIARPAYYRGKQKQMSPLP